jgi:drug/metabolite transporter (DMT)-like permease
MTSETSLPPETGRRARRAPRGMRRHSVRWVARRRRHLRQLPPTLRALLWSVLNSTMRALTFELHPFETQFLRYLAGTLVLLPWVLRDGWRAYLPRDMRGQFLRGGVHTFGLCLWFLAIPHITLADTTAIGFTTPLFIMLGAWLVLTGGNLYSLLMLACCPVFAASFLITKRLTRYETSGVIVLWQSITVTLLSLPFAIPVWQGPNATQLWLFLICGVLGSAGHYCLTRSYRIADISASQSVKFLELVWASIVGWLMFADVPSQWTLAGGVVIAASTIWIARREARIARGD